LVRGRNAIAAGRVAGAPGLRYDDCYLVEVGPVVRRL
jgi:hypothetical protein